MTTPGSRHWVSYSTSILERGLPCERGRETISSSSYRDIPFFISLPLPPSDRWQLRLHLIGVTQKIFGVGFKILRCTGLRSTRCQHKEASDPCKNGLWLWSTQHKFSKTLAYLQRGVYVECTLDDNLYHKACRNIFLEANKILSIQTTKNWVPKSCHP